MPSEAHLQPPGARGRGQQRQLPPLGEAPPWPRASAHPRNTTPTSSNCREPDSRATFVDQILDFEAAKRDAFAARYNVYARLPGLLSVETGCSGNEPGNRFTAAGNDDLLTPF